MSTTKQRDELKRWREQRQERVQHWRCLVLAKQFLARVATYQPRPVR